MESKNSEQSSAGKFNKKLPASFKHKNTRYIVAVLLVAVIGLVSLAVYESNKPEETNQPGRLSVCTQQENIELLQQASVNLRSERVSDLKNVARRIMRLENYQRDPDCLNVTTTYYLHAGLLEEAQENLSMLERVYDENAGFSDELGVSAKNIDQLRKGVQYLSNVNEQAAKNQDAFSGVSKSEQ